jgi:hypothetical protein
MKCDALMTAHTVITATHTVTHTQARYTQNYWNYLGHIKKYYNIRI